ncbi:MAG TPA: hypothetical protein VIF62_08885 [Labilithrix sp.]
MRKGRLIACVLVAAALTAHAARAADPNEGGAAAAEQLFQEGRKAADAHRYADACPKFLASQKLSPAVGTLLNLADCYEKNNQLASAWARFHEAIALAQRLNRPDRERTARERADKLEPRLIKLTIVSKTPNVDVHLDGNAIDPAVLGTPLPVDAGKHTLDATAKGKKTYTTSVDVTERNRAPSVEIPLLEDESQPATPTPGVTPTPKEPDKLPTEETNDGGTQRILGIVAIGVGVVGVGVGTFFGLRTGSQWNDAKAHCSGFDCDATGVDLAGQAQTSGNVSTVAFIVGGVFAAGGLALYFTAPSGTKVGIAPGGIRGTF